MEFRIATRADVPAVLDLLADDDITRQRGYGTVPEHVDAAIWAAFEAIEADDRNELIVAVDRNEVVGTCQLTFIPGLSRGGGERLLIEAVRIRSDRRGRGLGGELIRWAVDRARERGCRMVQLTTDKRRTDAHRFYERLGFTASHEGFKLAL
ncbi:putative GCN5-related N-acetyltransferase [Actinoplanes missouriensis 431]|uniref:Putative GCN5-related N-acetyltransferase n=1 Tax=Actinoplanes missouriensis (strain ATCC 14538 / DSM 43046 / CBS 188.64 / JCM 3121 / NBRC 102363 / NCIMB 12654 / NRRL B-3342 / UNCC 431) TaxID=512565 RepID=I0HG99_ACTM4|nr:GNAT family N-acetyltransferase [Actinoplanes missouriensis]BAL92036.1 putative GCN5-related N-acetyltransferase [Actinoplanes missouriensis 431]